MKGECYGVYSRGEQVQVHQHYKRKTKQKPTNRVGRRTAARENRTTGGKMLHHGLAVAATMGLGAHWWCWSCCFPVHRVLVSWCFALGCGFCLSWGHFGPLLLCSLIHMASRFILSSITWLISHESAIKTRKSKN